MSDNWSFREDEPFLEEDAKVTGEDEDHSYKAGWKTNITYNGNVVAITWFNDTNSVRVVGGNGLTEKNGKKIAVLGVALIKLLRSGENCLVEL
jgi:hypothetical protein